MIPFLCDFSLPSFSAHWIFIWCPKTKHSILAEKSSAPARRAIVICVSGTQDLRLKRLECSLSLVSPKSLASSLQLTGSPDASCNCTAELALPICLGAVPHMMCFSSVFPLILLDASPVKNPALHYMGTLYTWCHLQVTSVLPSCWMRISPSLHNCLTKNVTTPIWRCSATSMEKSNSDQWLIKMNMAHK